MATMVPNRRSTYGTNCVRCKDELIAPERSEYRQGNDIRHLWHCSNCETSFEALESIPVGALTTDDILPSALVPTSRAMRR